MSTAAHHKAIARRADEELFNRGNLAIADELFAPDFVYHDPASHEDWHGPASVKRYAAMLRAAFPDLELTVEDQVADGDRVAYRWTARGTHRGELLGLAPTGQPVALTGIAIMRLAGGQIVELWEHYDTLGLLQQLGARPAATPAPVRPQEPVR